jgi:hypothetical protein
MEKKIKIKKPFLPLMNADQRGKIKPLIFTDTTDQLIHL